MAAETSALPFLRGRISGCFSYRKSGSNRPRRMTLDAREFIRRFLQHVLPTGFQKVRHYGFASPNAKPSCESVRWLVALHYGLVFTLLAEPLTGAPTSPPVRCPACGAAMWPVAFLPPPPRSTFDTS